EVPLFVPDAAARRHDLNVARNRAAFIVQVVAMRDRAFADIGDDFHVAMGMGREAGLRANEIVVPDAELAPAHASGIVIAGEGEVMLRGEPAVLRTAKTVEIANIDHGLLPF